MRFVSFALGLAVLLPLAASCGEAFTASSSSGASGGSASNTSSGATVSSAGGASTSSTAGTGGSSSSVSSVAASSSGMPACVPPMAVCGSSTMCVDLSNDPANCGACGYSCGGSTCLNGGCVLAQPNAALSYAFGDRSCLAVDGNNVYFSVDNLNGNTGSGGVLYVPIGGGPVKVLDNSGKSGGGVFTYNGSVYWTDPFDGAIYQTPEPGQGGSQQRVVQSLNLPVRVAVDAANIYYTDTNGATAFEKATGNVLWTSSQPGGSPWGLAVDTSNVFYTDPVAGAVVGVNIASGASAVLASGQAGVRGLVSDTLHLAWTLPGAGAIVFTHKTVLNTTPLLTGLANPWELALDTSMTPFVLYWTDSVKMGGGDVSKAAAQTGSSPTVIAGSQTFAQCVAIAGNSVFWMTDGGTMLMKAPR